MGIAEELYDGGNLLKLELREGGIMNANGELHKVGNATIQSNIVNTHNSVAGLNFNIITTPLTCDILGTAEIDILGFDMNSINYVWNNGANTHKIEDLSASIYKALQNPLVY